MTTAAADPVFLDTNILVYASVDASPSYQAARAAISDYEASQTPLWISRQVLHDYREYLATFSKRSRDSLGCGSRGLCGNDACQVSGREPQC
jgi:predicted nucleic acid-binding protein